MATQITISKVNYGNSTSGPQTWNIKYKKYDAISTTTVTTNALDNGAGNLISPVVISGLISGELYYVQITNNCQSPAIIYQQSIQM